jgi:DNA-binding MarR family transcriptional regulator
MADDMALLVADIYEAAGALRKSGEAVAGAEGQTQARWQVLSVVSEEALSVPRAARRLGVARQSVQRIANELVHDGLARFQPNPDHRSSPLLALTPTGHRTLDAITIRAQAANQALTADIPAADIAAARALLRHLTTEIRRHEENG